MYTNQSDKALGSKARAASSQQEPVPGPSTSGTNQSHQIRAIRDRQASSTLPPPGPRGTPSQEDKARQEAQDRLEAFAIIYQTNVGCRALNATARELFAGAKGQWEPVNLSAVVDEYRKNLPDVPRSEFASIQRMLVNGERCTPTTLASWTQGMVQTAANDTYRAGAKRTTYRAVTMTQSGVVGLARAHQAFNNNINDRASLFTLGQFFSTSISMAEAQAFWGDGVGGLKVLFEMSGASGWQVRLKHQHWQFSGRTRGAHGEGEWLYSPKAVVQVTGVVKRGDHYVVQLQEMAHPRIAPPALPH